MHKGWSQMRSRELSQCSIWSPSWLQYVKFVEFTIPSMLPPTQMCCVPLCITAVSGCNLLLHCKLEKALRLLKNYQWGCEIQVMVRFLLRTVNKVTFYFAFFALTNVNHWATQTVGVKWCNSTEVSGIHWWSCTSLHQLRMWGPQAFGVTYWDWICNIYIPGHLEFDCNITKSHLSN